MSLFSKPKAVLWPKAEKIDLYLDLPDDNIFTADLNIWKACSPAEFQSLNLLFSQHKITSCQILIPDDVVFTKTFIYDSETKSIDKNEVLSLAENFVHFKINPDYIDYSLKPVSGKTIIQAHIFDKSKIEHLKTNLLSLKLKSFAFESVSQAIAKTISRHFDKEYFLLYPLNKNEYTLLLAQKDSVYLTSNFKGTSLDVQKIINYSKLYFSSPTTKFYLPSEQEIEINSTSTLDKTAYNQSQIAVEFKKAANLPLPVIGLFTSTEHPPDIINSTDNNSSKSNMENKKNFLPFIIVFIITALVASVIIWLVLNKNNSATENSGTITPTPTSAVEIPTPTPIPTVVEIDKKLKLQVLNATDINGQAAVLKEKLTQLGFLNVTVGNSKEKSTENQLKLKASLSSDSAYFQNKLAGFFDVTPTTDLKNNSTYDVVFIIGTKLGGSSAEASPTGKITPTEEP